ncbi:SDR family oxidoreductase [Streptomyces sp. TRM49041]|uniref:SDR family oxidoreductase n=1 Tax=Streptomyces sp. TRM49041 TaxID=2603216 RepID=UPI0011ED37F4|nr:SDR family oxidoreductase [Streptomyces sp. TRM49041]
MRIAIAGGTGIVGRHVVDAVTAAGHTPVTVARSHGVDLLTGSGLDAALAGVDTVIDVTNVMSLREKVATAFFETAGRNLLAAEEKAGVGHHVTLSIVGVDRVPGYGYYQAKLRQEQLLQEGRIPWTVLRATQFHEFAQQILSQVPGPLALVPRMRCQPVAAREVAHRLVELATGPAQERAPELAGPKEEQLVDMARRLLRAQGRHRLLIPVKFPGATGAAMTGEALLPTEAGPRGRQTFGQWLDEAVG